MSEPASTDDVMPDAPNGIHTNENSHSSDKTDEKVFSVAEKSDIKAETQPNGRVESSADGLANHQPEDRVDTPAKPNGHIHHDAAFNGVNGHGETDGERPSKRQRTREATPPNSARKPKPESPPWKRAAAEGPTSYRENGRRKSGRINTVPIEHQSSTKRRITRGALGGPQASPPSKTTSTPTGRPTRTHSVSQKHGSSAKASHSKAAPTPTPKSAPKKTVAETKPTSRPARRRSSPIRSQPTRHSSRAQRSSRAADDSDAVPSTPSRSKAASYDTTGRSPRIKLRVSRSGIIPLVHPDQARKRPKIGSSFEDFWNKAGDIPVEDGGLQASEDGPSYTKELAQKDARLILRIEDEAEPGGLLSQQRCSLYAPEASEEPPRQWARQDHMVKAMTNFRRLMLMEQQRHRATAKRIAEACRDEWVRRQPKSEEQLAAEAREYWLARYRIVAKSLFGTWDNVRLEVNRRRLEEWEAEEQRRVKAALNEAVNLSEQKLQARQGGLDSEMLSEEDGFSDLTDGADLSEDERGTAEELSDGSNDGDDSDNMSSSEDEEGEEQDDIADEHLTQEQLRAKYASIPASETPPAENADTQQDDSNPPKEEDDTLRSSNETSDESVDMDDDMGSSDMEDEDMDDDDESGSESSDDEAEAGGDGLLGMLFGKSELKEMQNENEASEKPQEADQSDHILAEASHSLVAEQDEDMRDDENEVSLIQHPDSVNGDEISQAVDADPVETSSNLPISPNAAESTLDTVPSPTTGAPNVSDSGHNVADSTATRLDDTQREPSQPSKLNQVQEVDAPLSPVSGKVEADDRPDDIGEHEAPMEVDSKSIVEAAPVGESKHGSSTPQNPTHKTEVPFLLRGTLREYQHHGLDWLAGLYANNTNGILADEMGLGKTIQTIALLAHLACQHEVWGPHLVVVPTSVMLNWEMEFKKWCPGFKILAYYGTQEERKRKRQGWNNNDVWNVCITSYQLVLQDQQVFKRRRWHYLILDEAHNIKNFKSQRWQTLLGFNTQARLLLTGTPLQNNLTELWSLLFFLMPAENGVGGFADLQEFHDWFHKPESQILESGREQMDDEARAIISKLHKVLRPYLLRRLKADVEKQMPGKYEHVEFCRLSKRQRELYDGFLSRADTKNTLASGNYMSIINCLMQLRKVCNHPDLFVDRPIMTSFRMQKSVAAEYQTKEETVHRRLLAEELMKKVSLGFLNLIPTQHEHLSTTMAERVSQLSSNRSLADLREAQKARAQNAYANLDPSTVESNIAYIESAARWGRFEELQHCVYLNALRRQQKPIYGKNLIELVSVETNQRPFKPRPKVPRKIMAWFEEDSTLLRSMVHSVDQRADSLRTTIEKFSCATPAVVTRDLEQVVLGRKGTEAFTDKDLQLSAPVHWTPWMPKEPPLDPWHEARMRLSIQFPDKRLLQYDCGKLQVLDGLLRRLQAGGHRALIFTQMTKVLDILEQFLNIHGHKYLRLDGATKVEQRQILTDRFNHDPRILCFILSTRSGGLGINLTGADTVIFYDQDWNPAMDKQCQDRCHRIGQTRDVHIYRLVSEHTIEANILRKASQKQMLDDVVIQEGEFTTDTFNKVSVRDVLQEKVDFTSEGVSAADAALDRVLGGPDDNQNQRTVGRVLEQAEDREDVTAARAAEKEIQADDADFTEKPSNAGSGASTTRQGTPAKSVLEGGILDDPAEVARLEEATEYNAWGDKMRTVDDFMLDTMFEMLKYTKLELPKDKKKGKKKGKDTRKR